MSAREPTAQDGNAYRLLFQKTPSPQVILDAETLAVMEANEAALRLYGYAREEFIGINAHALCAETLPAPRGGQAEYLLYRTDSLPIRSAGARKHRAHDGTIFDAEVCSVSLSFQGRKALLIEVQEVKRNEEVVPRRGSAPDLLSQNTWQRLFESNVIGILQGENSGRIINANQAFLDMVGYAREDLHAGRVRWDTMTPPEFQDRDVQAVIQGNAIGITPPYEKEFIHANGKRIPVLIGGAAFLEDETSGICFVIDQTERKRAELSRHESEVKFRLVIESQMFGIFFWHPSGAILDANDTFLSWVGYDREDLRAGRLRWRDLTPEEYRAADELALQEIGLKKACTPFEKEFYHKEGTRIPVMVGGAWIGGGSGQGVCFVLDLREQKKAKEEKRYSERIFENLHDGVMVTDLQHQIINWNPAAERIFGFSKEEVLGKTPTFLFGPAVTADVKDQLTEALAKTGRWEGEMPFVRKDGTHGISETVILTITDANGNSVARIGVNRDITRRRDAENKLLDSDLRHRLLTELTSDYTYDCRVEPNGEIFLEAMSEGFTRLTGFTVEEAVARGGWAPLIHPEDLPSTEETRKRLLAGKNEFNELRIVTKSGDILWIRYSTHPVVDPKTGRVVRLLGAVQDITTRRQAEEKLKEYADKLRVLSHRLLEVQEQERRHLARELHDEIGQLLTALQFNLESKMTLPGNAVTGQLEMAKQLVRDLMAKARNLSANLRPAMLEHLGLVPALLWYTDRYKVQTKVSVHFRHGGLENRRFGTRLETAAFRIVQEALTNVARHAGVREVQVGIWATGDGLKLQIEDRGKGFDLDLAKNDSNAAGLSGMEECAELLGGHLTVDSLIGRGTLITAMLPIEIKTTEALACR